MNNFFRHIHLVTKHRHRVFRLCCKCGLFWRGLTHDLSKFSWVELSESVKYYTGHRSPIDECIEKNGFSQALIHHTNKNKHHIEYWYNRQHPVQMNMPYQYAVECVCDKISATMCYKGKEYKPEDVLDHWLRKGSQANTNDRMKAFFTKVFTDLINLGEKQVLNKKYMKKTYQEIVKNPV